MADTLQIVGFMLGREHYGLDIMGVEEIIRMMEITPVPRAPHFVEGIINLRNQIIPVIDLRKRLKMPPIEGSESTRIVVMKMESRRLGFIVDKVEEVVHIPAGDIEEAPGMASKSNQYVSGVARTSKGMVILLDIVKMFTPDEHMMLAEID